MRKFMLLILMGLIFISSTLVSSKHNINYVNNRMYSDVNDIVFLKYTTPIIIKNLNNYPLDQYQVKIVLNSSWDGWSYVKQDGGDIRFSDVNGHKLAYYIENWDYTNRNVTFWIKVPYIPGNSQLKIYLIYDGKNIMSESNGDEVFDFFDDFNSGSLDKWSSVDCGTWIEDNGLLIRNDTEQKSCHIISKISLIPVREMIETKIKFLQKTGDYNSVSIGFTKDGTLSLTNMFYYYHNWLTIRVYNNSDKIGEKYVSKTLPQDKFLYGYVKVSEDSDSFTYDGTTVVLPFSDVSGEIPLYSNFNVFIGSNKMRFSMDWIRVRKFSNIEPSIKMLSSIKSPLEFDVIV